MKAKITMSKAKATALAGALTLFFPELARANNMPSLPLPIAMIICVGALFFFLFTLFLIVSFIVAKIKGKRWELPDRKLLKPALYILSISFVISLLTVPNLVKFPFKVIQNIAKANLGYIYEAQRSYYSNANTYAGGADVFQKINWENFEPAGGNRYAYYCDSAVIHQDTRDNFIPPLPDKNWPVEIRPRSSQTGFTCMAIGNIDNDDLDVWSINDQKVLMNLLNDL